MPKCGHRFLAGLATILVVSSLKVGYCRDNFHKEVYSFAIISSQETEKIMPNFIVEAKLMDSLDRIVRAMEEISYRLPHQLSSGLDKHVIESKLAHQPWRLPKELHAFYAWRNGLAGGGTVDEFFPGGTILSLDQAIMAYNQQMQFARQIADHAKIPAEQVWNPRWFPIFVSNGDYYVVQGSEFQATTSPVFFVANQERKPVLKFGSLTDMMEVIARCYEQGAYRVGAAGLLEGNDAKSEAIANSYGARSKQSSEEQEVMGKIEQLVHALVSANGDMRGEAATQLIELRNEAAIPLLIEVIKQGDAIARTLAIRVLGEFGSMYAVDTLTLALSDPEEAVRGAAITALGQIKEAKTIPQLMRALDDPVASIRTRAIWALGELKARDAAAKVAFFLEDSNMSSRHAAIQFLGKIGDTTYALPLLKFLKDQRSETRILAVASLGEIGGQNVLEALQRLIEDQNLLEQQNLTGTAASSMETIMKIQQARQLKMVAQQAIAKIEKRKK